MISTVRRLRAAEADVRRLTKENRELRDKLARASLTPQQCGAMNAAMRLTAGEWEALPGDVDDDRVAFLVALMKFSRIVTVPEVVVMSDAELVNLAHALLHESDEAGRESQRG